MIFNIFGSLSSRDYDVVVFVDDIPTNIDINTKTCKSFQDELSSILTDKPVNVNIAVFNNGNITKVYKGTVSELNNALYYTYKHHKQFHPLVVTSLLERDSYEKLLRVYRGILTFYSRSSMRNEIKQALRSKDIDFKKQVISKIDLSLPYDFSGKKESITDIRKVLAFQFGQYFSLIDGYEPDSYTKEDIAKNYPDLEPFLTFKNTDDILYVIEDYKLRLINI